jgi:hypothetical protein
VERYMPGYELWRDGIWGDRPWNGNGLKLFYGSEREVTRVEQPPAAAQDSRPTETAEMRGAGKTEDVKPMIPLEEKAVAKPTQVEKTKTASESTNGAQAKSTSNDVASISPLVKPRSSSSPISASSSETRYNPNWSRKFLAAKSPLIPTYDSVPPLSALHQDSIVFKTTRHVAFFPVQGPGGRLGVHPLSKKGRMEVGGEGYLSNGVGIAAFDVELAGKRVAIAGEDGVIRLWTVEQNGIQGVGPEAELVLKGKLAVGGVFRDLTDMKVPASTRSHKSHSIRPREIFLRR